MQDSGQRYDRQKRLLGVGEEGQSALQEATVALVGLGALGCTIADQLTRAGVGRMILIDRDVVDWSNLQRQSLFTEADAHQARLKVEAAAERLQSVNSKVTLVTKAIDLAAQNIKEHLHTADLVADGTDNFATRYLLNDWAVDTQKPWVYAGVVSTYGMVASFPVGAPCLRCTYPEPPATGETPTCRSAGVLGPAVGMVASYAAAEVLRALLPGAPSGELGFRSLDVWQKDALFLKSKTDAACPCCQKHQYPWLHGQRGVPQAEPLCGADAVQIPPPDTLPDLGALAQELKGAVDGLTYQSGYLRFQMDQCDVVCFEDGRALVRGTEDPAKARGILAKVFGS
ncbi:MAG: ThiF family adenylyltransferase [Planctomycetota bacterium]|nr:ThiF family adenylyltransferase [Planctomycetota bacterium]